MRLSKIKLAGFKSFVEPTTIDFPSNLVGVVGPNGCGKSNVIDAVRWVMGESSASRLRGDSITDVIFNGSSARKPVGMASIELLFDNTDGKVGGQYAAFNEISVRRTVSRDAISSYYLNGTKCRRKDITQIFLGTGLGPRSYSIIEQGMISRLIEAKPEEMRVFIEEAAGISKYKERRRETENRIKHTRENLERLTDLLEEVQTQLRRLDRQAKAAERYKKLKNEERKISAELLGLKLRDLTVIAEDHDRVIADKENQLQSLIASQRKAESGIEESRERLVENTDAFNEVQGEFYQVGSDIARLEQSLEHNREMRKRQAADLEQAASGVAEMQELINKDSSQLQQLQLTLDALAPDLESSRLRERQSGESLQKAEAAMAAWQESWETFNRSAGEAERAVQVENTRIEQLQERLQRLADRQKRIEQERGDLPLDEFEAQLKEATSISEQQHSAAEAAEQALVQVDQSVVETRSALDTVNQSLDEQRSTLQQMRGRYASLEALQKAALGEGEQQVADWLSGQSLTDAKRVAQQLRVNGGWEIAVETVLGSYLQAVCVDDIDKRARALSQYEGSGVVLVDAARSGSDAPSGRLLGEINDAPAATRELLASVRCVNGIDEALALRDRLDDGESVVTRDGIWIGRHWVRMGQDATRAGVLQREQEMRELHSALNDQSELVTESEQQRDKLRTALSDAEAQRNKARQEAGAANRTAAEAKARVQSTAVRLEETQQRLAAANSAFDVAAREANETQRTLDDSRKVLERTASQLETVGQDRARLESQRAELRSDLDRVRQQAAEDRSAVQDLALKFESGRSSRESAEQGLQRMTTQLQQYQRRQSSLQGEMDKAAEPVAQMQETLATQLEQRVSVEQRMGEARSRVENVEQQLRELELQRSEHEASVGDAREQLGESKLAAQDTATRREGLLEQLSEMDFELESLMAELDDAASADTWGEQLVAIQRKIERLGPINLAAIDEQREQSERKEYLDAQLNDLNSALTTLENAIRKIDRETRNRFKETYDQVNTGFQRLFPQLFGGGQAYMELTGDDLLAAGVTVMARPPGKRNSTIHLLSGGEKALTAVALVFAIFELNPAPFCMLDEVDAPLDDANVGRFCNIVKQMSDQVQFVFISHNKATMEMAQQLMGVTMNEPGVSRLVAVDIDEAVKMTAS
ncbi:MAG: chromosome segregation protein SMC [Pseudomonadota bacterium]